MKRKKYVILIISIIVLLILNLYDEFVLTPIRKETFSISSITIFCGYVGRPLFWLLIGFLVSSLLVSCLLSNKYNKRLWRIFPICGWGLIVIYIGMVFFHFWQGGDILPHTFVVILMGVYSKPTLFLIPGILIGICTDNLCAKQKYN